MFISWQRKWVLLFEFIQSHKPSFSLAFLPFVQHFIHDALMWTRPCLGLHSAAVSELCSLSLRTTFL